MAPLTELAPPCDDEGNPSGWSRLKKFHMVNLAVLPIFPIYFTIEERARFLLGEHPYTVNSERFPWSQVLYFIHKNPSL